MNDFAGLPWYVRHGLFAAFMSSAGIGYRSWFGVVIIFAICFCATLAMQIAFDGFHPSKW